MKNALVESQMALADSPASAPRRDFQVARFGANPLRDLVELREQVTRDVGAAYGIPRALLDSTASGQAARESWRQFVAGSIDGLARRLEAQILDQLGVEVALDTATLAGRDLAARPISRRGTSCGADSQLSSVLDPVSDTLGLLRCETDGERGLKTFGWRFPPIRRFSRGGGRVLTPWKIVFDGLLGDPFEPARAPDEHDQKF